jgi:hypothetical protein
MARRKVKASPKPSTVFVIEPGMCFFCGCTEAEACEPGCWWVNTRQTLCSVCCTAIGQAVMVALHNLAERRRRP